MTAHSPRATTIPLVLIGVTRPAAVGIQPAVLDSHNASILASSQPLPSSSSDTVPSFIPQYQITAALDFSTSPAPYRYTAHHLRLLLHTLHPRPRGLVLGTNYDTLPVNEIEGIWDEYLDFLKRDEPHITKTVLIVLSRTHPENGPPPPGAAEEAVRQLDAAFLD